MTGIYIRRSSYQPPVAQAFTLHFETVYRHMMSCGGGGTCQMQGKGRLAHGGTGGNDIQVAPLPSPKSRRSRSARPVEMPVTPFEPDA